MLITVKQAADQMGVSQKTVYREMNRGKLTKIKVRGSTRISEVELIAYLKASGLKEVQHD